MKTVGYLQPVDLFYFWGRFGLSGPSMSNSICWLRVESLLEIAAGFINHKNQRFFLHILTQHHHRKSSNSPYL